jgi:hypothetical protein
MFNTTQVGYNDELYALEKIPKYIDSDELKYIQNIDQTKETIQSIEKEIADHLLLDEYIQRSNIETKLSAKKRVMTELTEKLSTLRRETDEEKEIRVLNEKNILESEKKKLAELELEFNSITIPQIIDKTEYVAKKKMLEYNRLVTEREQIKLNKNRVGNLIGNKRFDIQKAEENLQYAYNLPNEYNQTLLEINNLNKEIMEESKKLNSFNSLLRDRAIIEAKLEMYKQKLNENIRNYEKYKLQDISIISLNKIDDYDSEGNLSRTIINASDMYNKLNKLDNNKPTIEVGSDIFSQREYDFLRQYYNERISLYNKFNHKNNYLDEFEEDHQKWLDNCKNDLKIIKNRLEELNGKLKNQIFWTDTDHEKYNIQKKNIISEHIKYYNKTGEEINKENEMNYQNVKSNEARETGEITMTQYLRSINYQ